MKEPRVVESVTNECQSLGRAHESSSARAEQLIACLEGEIAKRDARIVGLEGCKAGLESDVARLREKNATFSAAWDELAALKAQEQVTNDESGLEAWAAGKFGAGGAFRGELCGNTDWALARLVWSAALAYAAPVSEAKAQGVVQWPDADEIMQMAFEEGQPADDASGYCFELEEFDLFIERLMSEVARLNATPVQQVSVPECYARLLKHAFGMTFGEDWNRGTAAETHRNKLIEAVFDCRHLLAAATAAPAADAGLVEARKANNELVNDLHVMTNKRRQLVDALTYLRECLDPEDYMGEISMHDFIDDALAAHRSTGVV